MAVNMEVVCFWFKKAQDLNRDDDYLNAFISAWISFNAFYYPQTEKTKDSEAWKELLKRNSSKEIWNIYKDARQIRDFNVFLSERLIPESGMTGGVWDMKRGRPFDEWDFGDDLTKYIGVLYQIRNNLFHGWKNWSNSNRDLVKSALEWFIPFIEKLYTTYISS